MEEARQIKRNLYSLSRIIKQLQSFIVTVNGTLQAEPDRFVLAAPIGLASMRTTLGNLFHAIQVIHEVNEATLQESEYALSLTSETFSFLLHPMVELNNTAVNIKPSIVKLHGQVARLHGYLNSVFVSTVVFCPAVEQMLRQTSRMGNRIAVVKRTMNRLTGQELTSGLPQLVEKRLRSLKPKLGMVEQDLQVISAQMALIMGRMTSLTDLCSGLESLVKMAVIMDGFSSELQSNMTALKVLGRELHNITPAFLEVREPQGWIDRTLTGKELPWDAVPQLEQQLSRTGSLINPMLEPLVELTSHVKSSAPSHKVLNELESALLQQQNRLEVTAKSLNGVLDGFDRLFREYKYLTDAA